MILLDSHVIAEALQPISADMTAQEWLDQQPMETLFLSEISLTELKQSLKTSRNLKSPQKTSGRINKVIEEIRELFGQRLLGFDEKVMASLALVEANANQNQTRLSVMDSMIAATALAYDFQVASRDTKPFKAAGLKVINPWEK